LKNRGKLNRNREEIRGYNRKFTAGEEKNVKIVVMFF